MTHIPIVKSIHSGNRVNELNSSLNEWMKVKLCRDESETEVPQTELNESGIASHEGQRRTKTRSLGLGFGFGFAAPLLLLRNCGCELDWCCMLTACWMLDAECWMLVAAVAVIPRATLSGVFIYPRCQEAPTYLNGVSFGSADVLHPSMTN